MMTRYTLVILGLLTALPLLAAEDDNPLVFGVFPYLSTNQLEALYAPVAADLSEALGRPVQLRTRPSFEMFRSELSQQRYDLIFVQPFGYVANAAPNGYRSIARVVKPLSAIFVTRADSDIQGFEDLRGKTISNPPRAAAVSLLARQALAEQGLQPGRDVRLTYQNSHAACLREVLIRRAAACVTAMPPLKVFEARSQVSFKTVARSDGIPSATFALHSRVPEADRQVLADRIAGWTSTEAGRHIIQLLKIPGYRHSRDEDYDPVRAIANGHSKPAAAPATEQAQDAP